MEQNNKESAAQSLASFLRLCRLSVVFPIIAAVSAVSFFISMRNFFDYDIGHFRSSAAYAILLVCCIASLVLSAAFALKSRRSVSFSADPPETPLTVFGAIFTALMSIGSLLSVSGDMMIGVELTKFEIAYAVLVPFVAISMILSLIPSLAHSVLRQITAILAAAALNCSMFTNYFDFTLPLNSPIRNFITVTESILLIYMLSEARLSFGKAKGRATPPYFIFISSLASSLALGYSAGALALALIAPVPADPNPPIVTLAFYTAIGIHALGRILSLRRCIGEYVEPPKKEESKSKKNKKAAANQ